MKDKQSTFPERKLEYIKERARLVQQIAWYKREIEHMSERIFMIDRMKKKK